MRIIVLGDVVGRPGRSIIQERLPELIRRWAVDAVVVNGENAAGGFGITESILDELTGAGADVVTLGNHAFDQKEALVFIARRNELVRPANYPQGTPGRGATLVETRTGRRILVANVMGRVAMHPPLDDPFAALDRELAFARLGEVADAIVVDAHCEATSEKQAIGWHLDGRVSVVVGTHTHVPTADHRVLPGGTAFVTDIGMCGDYDSVIGMKKDEPMQRFLRAVSSGRFEAADGPGTMSGVAVETDDASGLARSVHALRVGAHLEEALPPW